MLLDAREANASLEVDAALKDALAVEMVNVFTVLKRDEVERYEAAVPDPSTREVTQWEIEEYLEDY